MTRAQKAIEQAQRLRENLSEKYGTDTIVWMGNSKFIVVKNGIEITIEA